MAPTTAATMVAATPQRIAHRSVDRAATDPARGQPLLDDLREAEEWAQHGVIAASAANTARPQSVPRRPAGTLVARADERRPDGTTPADDLAVAGTHLRLVR
jgi:hypothetical protein